MQYGIRDLLLVVAVVWLSLVVWNTEGLVIAFALIGCVVGIRVFLTGTRMRSVFRVVALLFVSLGIYWAFVDLPSPARVERRRRTVAINQLKTIACQLHNYRDIHGDFPPAYVADEQGKRLHSWRVLLCNDPNFSESDFHKRYNFDEPWDSPNNLKLQTLRPRWFRCPNGDPNGWLTRFVAVTGPGTPWPDGQRGEWDAVSDSSSTIMFIEVDDSEIHWMEPRDLTIDDILEKYYVPGRGIQGHRVPFGFPAAAGTSHVATADAGIHRLSEDLQPEELRKLFTDAEQHTTVDLPNIFADNVPEEHTDFGRIASVLMLAGIVFLLVRPGQEPSAA